MAETTETPATEEKPEQTVTVEDAGPACKRLKIEIPESRIAGKIKEAYEHLQNDAVLPGFRRGRAPQRLLEKRFASSVRDDVKGQLLSEAYSQAVEDEKLNVLGEPDVKDVEKIELPGSGPLSFEVEVEISPQVTLPDFATLKVEKPDTEVTDQAVDEEIEQYRERFGRMTTVEDATVTEEDFLQADVRILAGEDAGEDAEEIAHHPGAHILVHGKEQDYKGHAAGILIEDLGKKLKGKKLGEEVAISMTGPSGHEDERIKNKPITVSIRIEQVQRVELAAVGQLVEQLGVESEKELKDRIRQVLEQRAKRQQQSEMHKQALEQLAEQVELELPEGLTSRQVGRALQRKRMELTYQGKTAEQVEEALAEARSGSEEATRKELKQFFLLDQAAKDLDIEVSESEINGQIAMIAMQQSRRPEKLRQEMRQRGELDHLYMQIREQKTLDQIIEKANVTEAGEPKAAKEQDQAAGEAESGDKSASKAKDKGEAADK